MKPANGGMPAMEKSSIVKQRRHPWAALREAGEIGDGFGRLAVAAHGEDEAKMPTFAGR